MNKTIVIVILMALILSACGTKKSSWDEEEVSEVSDHIMADNVKVSWTLDQSQASSAGTLIRFAIKKDDGSDFNAFDINHEKLMHLIVVSKDLSYFNHIHPEYKGNGVFEITNQFPAGGDYKLIADFKPTGGDAMSKMEWVHIAGKEAKPVPIEPDTSLEKSFEGINVKLDAKYGELALSNLEAKKDLTLTFTFTDEKTGESITDLQPYLGAIGHVVVLSEDGQLYLHVHADEDQGSGPEASFETEFPKSGIYKIWGQFQRNNKVFTTSFVVNVQ